MLILTIRTDKPEAEIGLFDDLQPLVYYEWVAHRQLAESLLTTIMKLLHNHNKQLADVGAIACYQGPGSFTGLRIGLTVGNALSQSLDVPIVAVSDNDGVANNWINQAIQRLLSGDYDRLALPEYGAPATIAAPRTK